MGLEIAEVTEAGELVDAVGVAVSCASRDGGGTQVAWVALFGFFVMEADDVEEAGVVSVDGN